MNDHRSDGRPAEAATVRTAEHEAATRLRHAPVRLWDGATRLVHWLLVASVAFAWWSAETHHTDWHQLAGYGVLGLVIFRLIWGFVGSRSARFASFVRGPRATLDYARTLPRRLHHHIAGHNPVGAWSVLAILATLAVQVTTGLFTVDVDGIESGPLSDRVDFDTGRLFARVHHWGFTALEALIALHLVAVLFYALYKRVDLVRPMITGRARLKSDPTLFFAPLWRAVLAAAVAALLTYWAAKGLRFG